MSIADDVNGWFGARKLEQVFPDGGRLVRGLYLAAPIYDRLLGIGPTTEKALKRWTELAVELRDFVHGDRLRVPNKARPKPRSDSSDIKLLTPCHRQVWELRSQDEPKIRILGRFRARNEFVGLVWRYRCQLDTLDDWERAKQQCTADWDALHLGAPLTGGYPDDYVSDARPDPR
jgi:hypothetical protein